MSVIRFPGSDGDHAGDVSHQAKQLWSCLALTDPGPGGYHFEALFDHYRALFGENDPMTVSGIELNRLAQQHRVDVPEITSPCPSWCKNTPRHPYHYVDVDGRWWRWHSVTIGAVDGLSIGISAAEHRRPNGTVVTSEPEAQMFDVQDGALSAAEARQVAAALLNAADRLDELS